MDLAIDLVKTSPLNEEIYRQIKHAIVDGVLQPGTALPPTRQLAQTLNVSRSTVTLAYERLAAEGLIASRVGAGTFVSDELRRIPTVGKPLRLESPLSPRPVWSEINLSAAFAQSGRFDFRTGLPDTSRFPQAAWRRAVNREMRDTLADVGVYCHPAGLAALRAAIARHIGVSRGIRVSANDLIVTNGAQQAFDILARVLLAPGDVVAVEAPGYTPPKLLFKSVGAKVVGVPVDAEGLVVDALPQRARIVYVTPSHQYPLGVAMSLQRKLALLDWAERNNAAIIEDDYDCEFHFEGGPSPPIHTLDRRGRVVYVGSFSKTMLPTIRLGFLTVPPTLLAAAHRAKYLSDWHTPLFLQGAMARFIEDGSFARHVHTMNKIYRARRRIVTETLSSDFARHFELLPSKHGLHVAALARKASTAGIERVLARAAEAGILVHSLAFISGDAAPDPGIVIGYGAIETDQIANGLHALQQCANDALG